MELQGSGIPWGQGQTSCPVQLPALSPRSLLWSPLPGVPSLGPRHMPQSYFFFSFLTPSSRQRMWPLLDFQGSSGALWKPGSVSGEAMAEHGFICWDWEVWQCCSLELCNDGASETCTQAPPVLHGVS